VKLTERRTQQRRGELTLQGSLACRAIAANIGRAPASGMPAFKGVLTPEQIKAIYAYVKGRAVRTDGSTHSQNGLGYGRKTRATEVYGLPRIGRSTRPHLASHRSWSSHLMTGAAGNDPR
jgi:hypothetical protein